MEAHSSPPGLLQIWDLEAESEDFEKFVRDPSIPKTTKAEGLQAILGNMDVSDLTKRFLREPWAAQWDSSARGSAGSSSRRG